ncbi:putative ATP-binding protein [Azospirillaceae bacterium]
MVQLPSVKSAIDLSFNKQKIGMIGSAGIGKSCFFAQDPNALFLEAEAGLNFLEVYKVPVRNWQDIRDTYAQLKGLANEGKFPYSIIVLDTIDRICDYAEEEIVTKAREFYTKIADQINTIGDIPNGAGWAKAKDLVMSLLNKLEELPCALAFIGHLQNKEITDGVRKYHKSSINIGGKLGLELLAFPDHLLYVDAQMIGDKLKRTIYTKPTQSREAKSRGGIVKDQWVWLEDMAENYKYFRGLFK